MRRRLAVKVPGSTANLGPGFDTLALALGIYTTVTFDILETNDLSVPLISLKGGIAGSLPTDQSNLIYNVLKKLWKDRADLLQCTRITIDSDIPLGRGMGSSAAAILASVWAAYSLTDRLPDSATLLAEACHIEGHPDNLAASLHGGLVVCGASARKNGIVSQRLPWPDDWHTLLIVPRYSLTTKKARSVLPKQVGLEDAVANVQRVALLVSAVVNRDEVTLTESLHDTLHEPYRLSLVPELDQVRRSLAHLPALGCVLSGAGSSILVLVSKRHKAQILEHLETWASMRPTPPAVLDLSVDKEGLTAAYE